MTFSENILDAREAQRRLNSLITHVIKPRYSVYIGVFERQPCGRVHYHLLVLLPCDIRTGCDFEQFKLGNYKSASLKLRAEWKFWRRIAPRYGFGRTELLPIKSNAEGISFYVGKYISKHVAVRPIEDKGIRLLRYSNTARQVSTRFSWATEKAAIWRRKLKLFAQIAGHYHGVEVNSIRDITALLGPRWAFKNRDFIMSLPDPDTGEI